MARQQTFVRVTNQQVYDELKALGDKVDRSYALMAAEIKADKARIKSLENTRKGAIAFIVSIALIIFGKLTFWR